MKEWKQLEVNEICYLDNKDIYISINKRLNETALVIGGDFFISMGIHKDLINELKTDLDILEWFSKNTKGFWSDDVNIFKKYISDNFKKKRMV